MGRIISLSNFFLIYEMKLIDLLSKSNEEIGEYIRQREDKLRRCLYITVLDGARFKEVRKALEISDIFYCKGNIVKGGLGLFSYIELFPGLIGDMFIQFNSGLDSFSCINPYYSIRFMYSRGVVSDCTFCVRGANREARDVREALMKVLDDRYNKCK